MELFPAGLYSRGPRFLMMMIVFNRNSISWTQSKVFSAVEMGTISSRIRGLETTTRSTVPSEPFSHQMNVSKIKCQEDCVAAARTPLVDQHFNTSVSKFYASIPESQPILLLDCLRSAAPIARNGRILIGKDDGVDREFEVCIKQVQLEQDTAKSYKEPDLDKVTPIDLNRSGVGLIEIVAEPDLKMAKEASSFVRKLQTLLRFLGLWSKRLERDIHTREARLNDKEDLER
ncbi:GatB/GatE catalytic domain-domain-containing protein [Phakopsora pachyrhizi]|uniref:GatB/GatE catalytic domain-domain-containing protein n=1 Tax=Phakopsora pachyrhizi TaxID=170000 RepID=A0AAV0AWE0_PHAPC|nr:GatB/GatE catalytic domain-domain-containing protein [Phakopsora pachyrhizi]